MKDLNLRDYMLQILKYKRPMFIVVVITLVLSFVLNFFVLKPVYKSSASILVAQFAGGGIFTQSAIKDQIESDFFIQRLAEEANESIDTLRNNLLVTIPPGSNNTIDISVTNYSAKKCSEILNNVLNLLQEINEEEYTRRVSKIESSLNEAKAKLSALQEVKSTLEDEIKDLKSSQLIEKDKLVDFSILISTYSNILQQISETNYSIKDNEIVLMNSSNFKFFVDPSTPTITGPNKILNIILSEIIVLLLYLLLIFLKEYLFPQSSDQ